MSDEETRLEADLRESTNRINLWIDGEVEKRAEEWLRNAKGNDWTDKYKQLLIENQSLKSEISVARERLGPAGYKLLQELKTAREVIDLWREEWDCSANPGHPQMTKAIEAYDKGKK